MPTLSVAKKAVTSNDKTRLLFLDGEKGSVACRVHGSQIANPIPSLSPENTVETSFRTRLRLNNLIAVRGVPGEGMVGPADYYGNWERPEKYTYSIEILEGLPTIYQHENQAPISRPVRPISEDDITNIKATWISGTDLNAITAKKIEYQNQHHPLIGDSLFNNSGILEIEDLDKIELKQFNATECDLTPFKARLEANDEPFKITTERMPAVDEWRAVSYHYETGYAKRQIEMGGGLFLETHDFPQSITPIEPSAGGFVTLAKWKDEHKKEELEIIGVKIPFGYTLIIEQGCIHGDSDLTGMFMMCMTSNHVTMRSANTVFLKNATTKQNMAVSLEDELDFLDNRLVRSPQPEAPKPLVMYTGHENYANFDKKTKGMSFMFNPFSKGWWKKAFHDLKQVSLPLLGTFIVITIAITIAAIATLGVGAVAITAGSIGLAASGFFACCAVQHCQSKPNTRDLGFEGNLITI